MSENRINYETIISSLMAFSRDNFAENARYPIAHAAAAVTIATCFFLIAFKLMLIRFGVLSLESVVPSKPLAITVWFAYYLAHLVFFGRRNRWKKMLARFDSMTSGERRKSKLITLGVLTSVFAWFFLELALYS